MSAHLDGLARAALCLAFIASGLGKLLDFPSAIAEQRHFGLSPPAVFAVITIGVQLGGSALVLVGRGQARLVGALLLAGFTVAATLIGHPFWTFSGDERGHQRNTFLEHVGLVGGFLLVAAQARRSSARGTSAG